MEQPGFVYDDVCVAPARQIGCHSHAQWELSYVISGGGTRTVGNTTEPITPGEIIFLPLSLSHVWRFDSDKTDKDGNIRNISVFFKPSVIDGMLSLFPELRVPLETIKEQTEAISYKGEAYHRIRRLLLAMRGLTPADRLPLMMELIIAMADVAGVRRVGGGRTHDRVAQRCEKVRIYCTCNYARDVKLAELAAHVGMNKSAFCTFMRRHMGMSLSHYVNSIRLERAKEKLCAFPDMNISEIAISCGFANVTYFNRLYKARYGHSPKTERETLRRWPVAMPPQAASDFCP